MSDLRQLAVEEVTLEPTQEPRQMTTFEWLLCWLGRHKREHRNDKPLNRYGSAWCVRCDAPLDCYCQICLDW
jgi:hypothetical protein